MDKSIERLTLFIADSACIKIIKKSFQLFQLNPRLISGHLTIWLFRKYVTAGGMQHLALLTFHAVNSIHHHSTLHGSKLANQITFICQFLKTINHIFAHPLSPVVQGKMF